YGDPGDEGTRVRSGAPPAREPPRRGGRLYRRSAPLRRWQADPGVGMPRFGVHPPAGPRSKGKADCKHHAASVSSCTAELHSSPRKSRFRDGYTRELAWPMHVPYSQVLIVGGAPCTGCFCLWMLTLTGTLVTLRGCRKVSGPACGPVCYPRSIRSPEQTTTRRPGISHARRQTTELTAEPRARQVRSSPAGA